MNIFPNAIWVTAYKSGFIHGATYPWGEEIRCRLPNGVIFNVKSVRAAQIRITKFEKGAGSLKSKGECNVV